MGKYTERAKLEAARDYCTGYLGLREVARRHGVNVASLRKWAAAYRVHGTVGVQAKQRRLYSTEFKVSVVERKRDEQLSCRQTAALFNIRNFNNIGVWEREYEAGRLNPLAAHPADGHPRMTKKANTGPDPENAGGETRTRQELVDELNRLRMEVAYLKKLKALAQANREQPQGKESERC